MTLRINNQYYCDSAYGMYSFSSWRDNGGTNLSMEKIVNIQHYGRKSDYHNGSGLGILECNLRFRRVCYDENTAYYMNTTHAEVHIL